MSGRRAAAALGALALACAGAPPRGGARPGFRFPEAFAATQVVTVDLAAGPQEALASVRRAGGDYEVTLFEPILATPLLTAAWRGGAPSEELLVPGPRPGDGIRLVQLLRDLFGRDYRAGEDGRAEARGGVGTYRLDGLPAAGVPCAFPGVIEVAPRLGLAPRVRVRTVEVSCAGAVP